jgi:Restriction endonuclease AspBHI N-terminal/Restriction endonuclease
VRIGDVLRYPYPPDPSALEVDGLPNFYNRVWLPGAPLAKLDRGINPIAQVAAVDGTRRPAILIRGNPHRAGSLLTPWQDHFSPDTGHIRYFGDRKVDQPGYAVDSPGNQLLVREQFPLHSGLDIESRKRASPLVFFRGVPHAGKAKGHVEFQGFGVVERAEFVSQLDQKSQRAFSNVRYDFVVMSAVSEGEELDWGWINARRDPTLTNDDCLARAPAAWQWWVKHGSTSLPKVRRMLSRLRTVSAEEQRPPDGSKQGKTLVAITQHYADRKHRFELLAEHVIQDVVTTSGMDYVRGWITPRSADGGADFIGRLDVGQGLGGTRLVLLGQAKCEKANVPTNGNHIARTVARLRRGWIGAYVTTSFFSRPVQAEVIDDEYPIMLVGGAQVASTVEKAMFELGAHDVDAYLSEFDRQYEDRVRFRQPSEILLD